MPSRPATATGRQLVFVNGRFVETPTYRRDGLRPGDGFEGPALICEHGATAWIEPQWCGAVRADGVIVVMHRANAEGAVSDPNPPRKRWAGAGGPASSGSNPTTSVVGSVGPLECGPISLELFYRRFAAIAEQMGATLQRTALSTNVKERLDFSCAVFDGTGDLVSHAPHIPVHLGAMGQCVKCLLEDAPRRAEIGAIRPGDVFITNDPFRGGSHLPDVTVITPVFVQTSAAPDFFVASRAHHAEIGGITPGSMPPLSRSLVEEGVLIRTMRLPANEVALRAVFEQGPFPSRAPDQNSADVYAQVAANQRGVLLLNGLVAGHGAATVAGYMRFLREATERKTRAALARLADGEHTFVDALEFADRTLPIRLRIEKRGDHALFDFTGTAPACDGNLNATPAIVSSAVIYCLRCLINEDIPLNAGLLIPVQIIIPPASLLDPPVRDDPAHCPAVAGGNVETSQRIVDCIFGAIGLVAASQGTMNNLAFGTADWGYYETICGGAGAGPAFDGADAVHTHMTNTRLTDPEVLEARYPVRLRRFAIRRGSGGAGAHRGGDGVIREIEFLAELDVSLLTQRRGTRPYGLMGGQPGRSGRNTLVRATGESVELPAAAHVHVAVGDSLRIESPGGGGFGPA